MFELVRLNKRRSLILAFIMLLFMLLVGYIIGGSVAYCIYLLTHADVLADSTQTQRRYTSPYQTPSRQSYPNYPQQNYPHRYPRSNYQNRYPQSNYTTQQYRQLTKDEIYNYIIYYWGPVGAVVAFVIWTLQMLIAYLSGGNILLSLSNAVKISKEDHPQLYNIVEEMTIASRLPKMPDIYIIDDPAMNAFATGRSPEHSAVAVTRGLLTNMNRDQLQGVIAHEISHIVNRDTLYMTMLAISVGTIIFLVYTLRDLIGSLIRGVAYAGGRYTSRRRKPEEALAGGAVSLAILAILIAMYIFALILSLIAPLVAMLIFFASSRRREYLADASSAVLTRYPEGLASALEKIANYYNKVKVKNVNELIAPMYIVNPLEANNISQSSIFSTHPPLDKRIKILRSIASSPTFSSYQQVWRQIESTKKPLLKHLPPEQTSPGRVQPAFGTASSLTTSSTPLQSTSFSTPSHIPKTDLEKSDLRRNARMAGDALLKAQNYRFYRCFCGILLKIPPEYKGKVTCPRCKSSHLIE
ncbi:MAG: M48 family metallopeptidase [Candidatus Hydrogenedentes bacterium]|nr:M48 family metallopeptidase [Candidatus Hydrogenedentota bacterium]